MTFIKKIVYKNFFVFIFLYLKFIRLFLKINIPLGIIFANKNIKNIPCIKIKYSKYYTSSNKKILKINYDKEIFPKKKKVFIENFLIQANNVKNFSIQNDFFFYKKFFFFEKGYTFLKSKLKINKLNFNKYSHSIDFMCNNFKKIYFKKLFVPKKNYNTVINLSTHNNTSYFHWLIQPSLHTISSIKNFNKIKLNSYYYINSIYKNNLPTYIRETLKILKIRKKQLIYENCTSNNFYCLYQNNQYNLVDKKHIFFLRKIFLKKNNILNKYPSYIYISRKFSTRGLKNDDEIYNFLKKRFGFKRIFLEKMSLNNQIKTFQNAKIIIAAHGAGSANIVFCKKKVLIIEIFPDNNFSNMSIYNIAKILDINYGYIIGSKLLYDNNFLIDVKKIKVFLEIPKVKELFKCK